MTYKHYGLTRALQPLSGSHLQTMVSSEVLNGPLYRMQILDFTDRLGIPFPAQAQVRSVIVPHHLHMEESAVRQIPTALRTRLPAGGIVQKKASAFKILQE